MSPKIQKAPLWLALSIAALGACQNKAPDAPLPGKPLAQPAKQMPKATGRSIQGTLSLADDEQNQAPKGATLFLMGRAVKPDGSQGGLRLVKKVVDATLPYAFVLKDTDTMMPGMAAPDEVFLAAKWDQDGDAISQTPGDLRSQPIPAVRFGAKKVALHLAKVAAKPATKAVPQK